MNTIIKKLDSIEYSIDELNQAAEILKVGGLVAFPTETVYGLGANALDKAASKKIYEAKGRPSDNPLIVHIANIKDMEVLGKNIPDKAYQLAKVFWPGPLTIILEKQDCVPYETTGGLDTVALRLPANKIARDMITLSELYIAAPSANLSGKPSPTLAKHVIQDLTGKIDMILDGGKATLGLESTIIDLTQKPVILRPGCITKQMMEHIIGPIDYDPVLLEKAPSEDLKPKAPGMKYRHYSPEGNLIIYEGDLKSVVLSINHDAKKKVEEGYNVGIIATDETKEMYQHGVIKTIGSRLDEATIAAGLYDILRTFDEIGAEFIYSESFEDNKLGHAIMNRLLKAAGYQVVNVKEQ